MRIPLTIAADYLPEWGVTEGLRELVQNWLDADGLDHGEPTYSDDTVTLANPGATLSRSTLLLGTSSKRDDDSKRGQFGEGMKLGTLALVRAGCSVVIEAGGERWTATIEPSPDFGANVLTWTIEPSEVPHVEVKVGGLDDLRWEAARRCFRDLSNLDAIDTFYGAILTDSDMVGAVFVKGIKVADVKGLTWGYDLKSANVDRDRRLVRDWDLQWATAEILAAAMDNDNVRADDVFAAMERNAKDTALLHYHASAEAKEALASVWRQKHGDSVPVEDAAKVQRLTHLGIPAIVVPEQMVRALESVFGKYDDIVKAALDEVVNRWTLADLTEAERAAVRWAQVEIAAATGIGIDALACEVVTYKSDKTMGRFVKGQIELSRAILRDRFDTIATLLHEVAHRLGGDGDARHEAGIEQIWTALARRWHTPTALAVAS